MSILFEDSYSCLEKFVKINIGLLIYWKDNVIIDISSKFFLIKSLFLFSLKYFHFKILTKIVLRLKSFFWMI